MLKRESQYNIDLDTEPRNDSAPQNSKSRSDEADRLNSLRIDFPGKHDKIKVWKPGRLPQRLTLHNSGLNAHNESSVVARRLISFRLDFSNKIAYNISVKTRTVAFTA